MNTVPVSNIDRSTAWTPSDAVPLDHHLPGNGDGHLAILLVDDHRIQADHLRRSLMSRRTFRSSGAVVDIASSVEEVRRKLQLKRYHVGIQDLHCRLESEGEEIFKTFIKNNTRAIGLMSASPIGDDKLAKMIKAASINGETPIPIKRFERPVKTDDLENWLASLPTPTDGGNDASTSMPKALFGYPNAIVSIPAAAVLLTSIVCALLWILAKIALVHPLYPLLGIISGAGILIEIIIGIIYERESDHGL